jgi:tetratricopeptide (TPR) repeat protein
MYYGSAGVILTFALLLEKWCRAAKPATEGDEPLQGPGWRRERVTLVAAVSLVLLVGCGWRVTRQSETWRDNKALWTHTLSIAPDTMIARMNLGNHYTRHGQHELALEQYSEWTRIRPDFARAWRATARSNWRLQRHDEAVRNFRRSVEVADSKNPGSWSIHKELADYLRSLQRWPEALAEYDKLLRKAETYDTIPAASVAEIEAGAAQVRERLATWEPPVSPVDP